MGLVQVCRGAKGLCFLAQRPRAGLRVLLVFLNKADGIHRGGARARVCGAGDAGVCGVDCGVGMGAGERADDEFVSHSGAREGVGGCIGWFDWPVPWAVALALDHCHY